MKIFGKRKSISLVIPVYNEESIVRELLTRITRTIDGLPYDFTVVVVDDGSTDETLPFLQEIQKKESRLKIIRLSRNWGHQNAFNAGLDYVNSDAVILMDGDLQDPPEVIPDFIQKWEEGNAVVYGIREKRQEPHAKKLLFSLFYGLMERFSDIQVDKQSGMFSLVDKKVAEELKKYKEKHKYYAGLRSYVGFKRAQITYKRDRRFTGRPKQSLRKLINYALDAFFSFSFLPVRILTYSGFFILIATLLFSLIVLFNKLFHLQIGGVPELPGWTSIILLNFFILSIQIIFMGVLGEYIARIFEEVKNRPYYTIEAIYE